MAAVFQSIASRASPPAGPCRLRVWVTRTRNGDWSSPAEGTAENLSCTSPQLGGGSWFAGRTSAPTARPTSDARSRRRKARASIAPSSAQTAATALAIGAAGAALTSVVLYTLTDFEGDESLFLTPMADGLSAGAVFRF